LFTFTQHYKDLNPLPSRDYTAPPSPLHHFSLSLLHLCVGAVLTLDVGGFIQVHGAELAGKVELAAVQASVPSPTLFLTQNLLGQLQEWLKKNIHMGATKKISKY
jgi:hypothetical protein